MAYNGPINKKISILKRAYSKAKEYDLYTYMGRIKSTLSDLYREKLQYDSAMVALLEAENYCRLDNNLNEQVAILHRLGDFYYYANLLDKAEECYKKVLKLKGEPIAWKNFRYVVVTNNLGLIEKRRKNFEKQKQYFETTLNYVLSYNGGKINKQDTLRLAYIYAKLAGAYYQLGNITQAVSYYGKSLFFTNKSNYKENLIDLMLLKSKILLSGGKYDSSLVYLDGAEKLSRTLGSPASIRDIYLAYSELYEKKGDFKNTFYWYKKYFIQKDSIDKKINATAYLQIKAERENETNQQIISSLEREKKLAFAITVISIASLTVLLIALIRIRRSDKKLINKNIELVNIESHKMHTDVSGYLDDNEAKPEDAGEAKKKEPTLPNLQSAKLITKLDKLINDEKIYLNPELTLEDVAARLESNRTYLSKAINQIYNTNFSSYINDLRVKEAIRIISQNKSDLLSIEGIGKEVGFNNRITFISAFKKYSGVTPSFFIKNVNSK